MYLMPKYIVLYLISVLLMKCVGAIWIIYFIWTIASITCNHQQISASLDGQIIKNKIVNKKEQKKNIDRIVDQQSETILQIQGNAKVKNKSHLQKQDQKQLFFVFGSYRIAKNDFLIYRIYKLVQKYMILVLTVLIYYCYQIVQVVFQLFAKLFFFSPLFFFAVIFLLYLFLSSCSYRHKKNKKRAKNN